MRMMRVGKLSVIVCKYHHVPGDVCVGLGLRCWRNKYGQLRIQMRYWVKPGIDVLYNGVPVIARRVSMLDVAYG